jgi:hypothetical protein
MNRYHICTYIYRIDITMDRTKEDILYYGRIFGHLRQIVAGYSGVLQSISKLCDLKK